MTAEAGAEWLDGLPPALRPIVARCAAGELSPVMALMHLAWESNGADLRRILREAARQAPGNPRFGELARLAAENAPGLELVRRVRATGVDHGPAASIDEGIASARTMFDGIAAFSPEAGSALYTLGSPAILDAATAEIVATLETWVELGGRHLLDIGCGVGRIEAALGDRVASATGIDVSEAMIIAARERCAGRPNLRFRRTSGRDLEGLPSGGFDLAIAVDSLPYLVRSGLALVATHFAETARVLRPGGDFLIFNFSYRGDAEADRRDVEALAETTGFSVLRSDERSFKLWDATGFQLRRRDQAPDASRS